MNVTIEYRDTEADEKRRVGIDNVHGGQPLAEAVRSSFETLPENSYAIAVYVDGEPVL